MREESHAGVVMGKGAFQNLAALVALGRKMILGVRFHLAGRNLPAAEFTFDSHLSSARVFRPLKFRRS